MCTQVTFQPSYSLAYTFADVTLEAFHYGDYGFEVTGGGTSLRILECLVTSPVDLHTKPHAEQVCFVGRAGRASL